MYFLFSKNPITILLRNENNDLLDKVIKYEFKKL